MTVFQLVLLAVTAFFAYRIYEHIQSLQEPKTGTLITKEPAPFDPEALIEAADRAYEASDLGKAKALLAEADIKMPDNPEILNRLGFILAKEGDVERAIEHYRASLKIDGSDDTVHNAIASLYREKKDFQSAQKHYEHALAIDGDYEVTYFNYANLLVDMGEPARAKVMYEKALELKPDFMQAQFELDKLA